MRSQQLGAKLDGGKQAARDAIRRAFHDFVESATDSSQLQDVYIDAKVLDSAFAQSGVTSDKLSQTMPEVADQLHEALQTNGDVRIPIADYATHIAGTPIDDAILPHLKAEPDGMTYKEGQDYQADQAGHMQKAADDIVAKQTGTDQAAADSQAVYDHVFQQLTEANRFPTDVNKAYAGLTRDFYATQAERAGTTSADMLQRFPLRIGAEDIAGDHQLAQNEDHGSTSGRFRGSVRSELSADQDTLPTVGGGRAAQGWAGATRASREGRPVVLYRGAEQPLTAGHFGLDALGKASGNPSSGLGVWFTPHKGEAARYGTPTSYHLDIRNPKVFKAEDLPAFDSVEEANKFREQLRDQGHDGLIVSAKHLGGAVHMVAFDPHQVIHPASRVFEQTQRGAFDPDSKTIALLKNADLSTYLHEVGHHFLDATEQIATSADAPEGIKADFDTLLKSFGEKGDTPEERLANWTARDLEGKRAGHEQFAESFEKYLMEGKAPSVELQPLFSRFRSWLLSVYKSLSGQGVELTPQVRQVMDRMLATDEAIGHAESVRGYEPIFNSAEEAGMQPDEFERYQQLGAAATDSAMSELDAKSMRDMRWLAGAKERMVKGINKTAVEARKSIEGEARKEVDELPVFKVQEELATNKVLPPDVIAEMYGFADAATMHRAIDLAGSKADVVEGLTDQRMLERHGELTDPASIERLAEASIHNEARARFIATELKALSKATGPARALAEAAKLAADSAIAAKRVRDLRPGQYTAAEARAARNAMTALGKNDVAQAAHEKRAQLLNNRLARAAADAVLEVEKGLTYLKKFNKPAIGKVLGADYMDRITELLSKFDLSNRYNTRSDLDARQDMRAWLDAEMQRTGIRPEVSDALLDFTQRQHWKELSVENFRGLVDSVKSLEHVGREQTLLTLEGERIELDSLVDEAKASMATMEHNPPVDIQPHLAHAEGLNKISARFLQGKGKLRSLDAALLKMEQIFQWLDAGNRAGLTDSAFGAFSKIFKRMSFAEAAERGMRADSVTDLRALGEKLRSAGVDLHESLKVDLPRAGRGAQWYREELLAAALNTGNASNLKKLAEGYGWEQAKVLSALDKHMSSAEWDFVQGVWDAVGKYGPDISALQRRLTGVSPEMIKAQPVKTRHGTREGGYYPVVFDSFQDHNIDEKSAKNADMLFENQWGRPATSKGHTVERTGYVGPIQLSLGVISRHLDQVTHDLAWREPIIDANKFLSDERIKTEIDQVMGKEYTKQLRPWLQAMANDKVFNTSGDSGWENFYRKARSNATIVGLGFRLSTMQLHGLSALSTSLGEVGAKWMAKGAAQFAGIDRWADAKQFVYDRSPEMAHRMDEVDRNVHEAIDDINARANSFGPTNLAQKAVDGAKRFAFYGVAMLDMASAMPTWHGAYLKAMAKEADGGLNMSEDAAIEFANRAVRNAHGGGGVKDLAAVQRDKGAMSMATMFYSFWNHMMNRQRDLGKGYANLPAAFAAGTGGKDFARLLARSWYYFVVPQLIHALLKPDPKEAKEDDGSLSHFLLHASEEIGLGFVSGVPVIRDLANAAVHGRSYAISPLEQAGQAVVQAAHDAYKVATGDDSAKHPIKDAAQAIGYTFGLPTGQASSTGQFLWDVYHGDADPQGLKDWYQGLSTGKLSNP